MERWSANDVRPADGLSGRRAEGPSGRRRTQLQKIRRFISPMSPLLYGGGDQVCTASPSVGARVRDEVPAHPSTSVQMPLLLLTAASAPAATSAAIAAAAVAADAVRRRYASAFMCIRSYTRKVTFINSHRIGHLHIVLLSPSVHCRHAQPGIVLPERSISADRRLTDRPTDRQGHGRPPTRYSRFADVRFITIGSGKRPNEDCAFQISAVSEAGGGADGLPLPAPGRELVRA